MKKLITTALTSSAVFFTAASLTSCDVDKTAAGELPDVDVDVEADAGKLPEFEVRGPDVQTGTKTVEVEVPTVDVDIPEEEENEPAGE